MLFFLFMYPNQQTLIKSIALTTHIFTTLIRLTLRIFLSLLKYTRQSNNLIIYKSAQSHHYKADAL